MDKTPERIFLKDANGKKYTLEFDRKSVKRMIRKGFILDTEPSHLLLMAEELVTGAFQMHHSGMEWKQIEPIFLAQNKRTDLLKALAEMYMRPAELLMGTADEKEAEDENPTWEIEG